MKNYYINILISHILITIVQCDSFKSTLSFINGTTRNKHVSKCHNPSSTEMEKQYLKFAIHFKNFEDLLNISQFKKYIPKNLTIVPYEAFESKNTFVYGLEEDESSNVTNNMMVLCSWHTAIQYRQTRYPFLQTQAICNENKCSNIARPNDFQYSCQQFRVLRPILLKGKCRNGTYMWHEALEPVSVACLCRKEKEFIFNY